MTVSVRYINFFPLKSLEQGAQFSKSDTFKVSLRIQPRLHTFWTFPSLSKHCGYSKLSMVCKQPSEHFTCWMTLTYCLYQSSLWLAAPLRAALQYLLLGLTFFLPSYLEGYPYLFLFLFSPFSSLHFCSYELPSPYIMLSLALNFDICFLITPNKISPLGPCFLYKIVQFQQKEMKAIQSQYKEIVYICEFLQV